jgi:hypothetical protein
MIHGTGQVIVRKVLRTRLTLMFTGCQPHSARESWSIVFDNSIDSNEARLKVGVKVKGGEGGEVTCESFEIL